MAPSGSQQGCVRNLLFVSGIWETANRLRTYIVRADAGYVTSTTYGTGSVAGSSTISTVAPSGSQQGYVEQVASRQETSLTCVERISSEQMQDMSLQRPMEQVAYLGEQRSRQYLRVALKQGRSTS